MIKSLHPQYRVLTDFGKLLNVMEIENAIFQNLENFGKCKFFYMAMEKFWIYVLGKLSNCLKMDVTLCHIKHRVQ